MGFLDKDLVDRILGPKGLALIPPSEAPHTPNPFEVKATSVAKATQEAGQTFPSVTDAWNPFVELLVQLLEIPGPPPFASSAQIPLQVNLSGERLHYRRSGSAPGMRLTLQVGAQLINFRPGMTLVAPFSNFTILRRQLALPFDLAQLTNGVFQGRAEFIISKKRDYVFEEGLTSGDEPYCRPTNLMGQFDKGVTGSKNFAPDPVVFGAGGGGPVVVPLAGFRRIRVYVLGAGSTAFAPTLDATSGDDVRIFFDADCGYFSGETQISLLAMDAAHPIKTVVPDADVSFTWDATATSYWFEMDVAGWPTFVGFRMTVSNMHVAGVCILGVG